MLAKVSLRLTPQYCDKQAAISSCFVIACKHCGVDRRKALRLNGVLSNRIPAGYLTRRPALPF